MKGDKPRAQPSSLQVYRTRQETDRLIATGRSPLDVMLNNMRFWDEEARRLTRKLEEFAADVRQRVYDGDEIDEDIVKDMVKKLDRMQFARQNAQTCAKDAAPYVHPKLSAMVHKPPEELANKLPPITLLVEFDDGNAESITDIPGSEKATVEPEPASAEDLADFTEGEIERQGTVNDVIDGAA